MTENALPKVMIAIPLANSLSSEFFRTFYPAQNLMPEEGLALCEILKWGNTVNNRNDAVKTFLKEDFTHLFFMDSDMTFPESTLSRLLQHDKDIVGGFYTVKTEPYHSTCFVDNKAGESIPYQTYNPMPGETMKKVSSIGTGCMLIKRKVFEGRKWPWFYYKPYPSEEKFATEDVAFCDDSRQLGFEVWCDFTLKCGHVGHMLVTPFMQDGQSKVKLSAV